MTQGTHINILTITSGLEKKIQVFDYPNSKWHTLAPYGTDGYCDFPVTNIGSQIPKIMFFRHNDWTLKKLVLCDFKNQRKSTLAQFGAKSFTGHRKLKIQILLQISLHNIIVNTPVKFQSSTSINWNYIWVSRLLIIASNSCDITSDFLTSSV